ncbi:universal stress protein [Qipengyuania zhejiangensis]|uniref:universal stress protein n=1 Tax=Qipengyuania zhejiangensis TaxID=3077782 RepID=UPI002D76D6DD|nr:universal stress protein [Qipengyuania sp. Z2]
MAVSAFSFSSSASSSPVIACLDDTARAQEVAQVAANYSQWLDRPLIFFHSLEFGRAQSAMSDPLEWQLRRCKAQQSLQRVTENLIGSPSSPILQIGEGSWVQSLSGLLETVTDAVVVIGSAANGNTAHLASTLLDRGAHKLFVVPPGMREQLSDSPRIAVPLDGSKFSEASLAEAIAIARAHPAELLLLHVTPPAVIDTFGPLGHTDLELQVMLDRRNEMAAGNFLETSLRRLRDMGVKARSRCLKGDPRSGLEGLLAEESPELVLLSARGQGIRTCENLSLGSTANYLIDHLNLPVMIVGFGADEAKRNSPFTTGRDHARDFRGPLNSSPVAA